MASASGSRVPPAAQDSIEVGDVDNNDADGLNVDSVARLGPTMHADAIVSQQPPGEAPLEAAYRLSEAGPEVYSVPGGEKLGSSAAKIAQYRIRTFLTSAAQLECDLRALGRDQRVAVSLVCGASRTATGKKAEPSGRTYFTPALSGSDPCRQAGRALATCMLLAGTTSKALELSKQARGRHSCLLRAICEDIEYCSPLVRMRPAR